MILVSLAAAAALAGAAPSMRAPAPSLETEAPLRLSAEPQPRASASDRLTAFGLEVSPGPDGLRVDHVLPTSDAASLGFKAGDVLLDVGGSEASDAAAVAKALEALKPETRLWAVVRREGTVATLESELPKVRLPSARGVESLSPLEAELAKQHLQAAKGRQDEAIRSLTTPRLDVAAGQRAWVQFASGLPAALKTGDVLEGLVGSGVAADANLDYLAIAPRSQIWAEVVEADVKDGVRTLRLHVYKLKLRGGHSYAVSARVVDLAGEDNLTKLSSGGTIVSADPAGLGPDARLQVEFLKPVSLCETPSYFRAGPGLWLKQRGAGAERALEISHVIAGRSAERAGLKVGDVVLNIDGAPASKLDFAEGLDRLYGAPGTTVSMRVQRGKEVVAGLMDLARGVRYGSAKGKDEKSPIAPPFKP